MTLGTVPALLQRLRELPPEVLAAAASAAILLLILAVVGWRRRSSAGTRRSKHAHDAAQRRDPPVDLGETYEFTITEFTDHHSGDRVAVGKVEGFVLFADGVPDAIEVGDVVRVRVDSYNRGRTSADATYVGRR